MLRIWAQHDYCKADEPQDLTDGKNACQIIQTRNRRGYPDQSDTDSKSVLNLRKTVRTKSSPTEQQRHEAAENFAIAVPQPARHCLELRLDQRRLHRIRDMNSHSHVDTGIQDHAAGDQ